MGSTLDLVSRGLFTNALARARSPMFYKKDHADELCQVNTMQRTAVHVAFLKHCPPPILYGLIELFPDVLLKKDAAGDYPLLLAINAYYDEVRRTCCE